MTPSAEPCPIVRAFGGATIGHECSACKRIFLNYRAHDPRDERSESERSKQEAAECCGPSRCEKHDRDLGKYERCKDCDTERYAKDEAKQFASAKKVSLREYIATGGEYLFREGFGREGFFGAACYADMIACGNCPDWAFGTDMTPVSEDECDLEDHVADGILANHHEDAYEWVDSDKIKAASKLIFEACSDVETYWPDHGVVVLLRPTP